MERSVRVCGMQFAYEDQTPLYVDFNLDISPGSLCLLVGANGSGKTTLLRILAGKHMVGGKDVVQVLNRPAFHDTQLVCSGDLAYLGGSWSKTAGCAGEIPLQGDFSAQHMIFGVEGVDPARRDKLIELLDIDLDWRMHKVSDGQRRRVQICMGLLHPFQVLLLDEVTVDLDVVARMDLLDFFKEECQQRGATIVYATHIFDGLETWATHLAYVQDGSLKRMEKLSDLKELKSSTNLLSVVENWLRSETKTDKKKPAAVSSSSSNRDHTAGTAKVITSNGHLRQYPTGGGVSTCVSQVLLADEAILNRSHEMFVCNSDSLYYDDYIPALNSDVCLEPNQMYFILPITMLEKPLSATDMASLAVKATQALCSRSNKIKKLKVQPHDADEISTATPSSSINQLITASSTTTIKTFSSSSPSLISRKSSVRRMSRYSSRRAKSAVRSFRLTLNTIYEGVVL